MLHNASEHRKLGVCSENGLKFCISISQVGDMKKYTSVKESTNCPYYNEVETNSNMRSVSNTRSSAIYNI